MPDLDVSEICDDIDLGTTFTVVRRADAVSAVNGRSVLAEELFEDVAGIVVFKDPAENTRKDDSQMTSRAITITTMFRLRAAGSGIQPDLIRWQGSDFVITKLRSHVMFGEGVVRAEAESFSATDPVLV